MSTHLESKSGVIAKKPHRCDLCGEPIHVGTTHDTRTGVNSDGIWKMRMHPECQRYEQYGRVRNWNGDMVNTVDSDWYENIVDPAFDRSAAQAWELAMLEL